jgi:hypothetical protein
MEATNQTDALLARSVIVTGAHYSATTLVGSLLHTAPEFHLLHEPLNPQPTLSYDSLRPPNWYEYYDDSRWRELHDGLAKMFRRNHVLPEFAARLAQARTTRELGQALRYAERKLPFLFRPKPAIIKGPFFSFSAFTMQQRAGCKIVLSLRHPGAFVESVVRKARGFTFADLARQPALLAMLPENADAILLHAREQRSPAEQAALLWKVVHGFAARYLLPDPRTTTVQQEEFVNSLEATADRLLAFAGGTKSAATRRFLRHNFTAEAGEGDPASYIRRDPQMAMTKWRSRLSSEEIALVRSLTEEIAAAFGYDEASWPH